MNTTLGEREQFVQIMIRQIVDGTMSAGYRLPTESELAAQYGYAKTNIHLGVKELERYGLVKIVPRHAMYVEDFSKTITLEGVNAIFLYTEGLPNRATAVAMLELREMMACGVIRWMIRHPNRSHMEKLIECCDAMEAAAQSGDRTQFHETLLAFLRVYYLECGNDIFPLLVRSFQDTMTQAAGYLARFADAKELVVVYRAVLRHSEAGDLAAAEQVWTSWNTKLSYRLLEGNYFPNL